MISVGIDLLVVVPSPNWPEPLKPQVKTRPDELRAKEWLLPKDKASILSPESRLKLLVISVGIDLLFSDPVVPSPNRPFEFSPQT